ncbi:N-methyl-L-tryptophan oxidase [Microvirga brassicacearum]|uniref:N-methyl-L-tryptophan oxidase n=1 Tax=Microvirga brassicacearum TaxID=2580413 RepID=A0A5N3PCG9_9HYPH|nr:N-methyl-L-tryptophan oxidase [Microvirga brassicacearum]KAB0267335.1 N-methyl-L-tryptophan oxidase [Microvirga brassicacearum]
MSGRPESFDVAVVGLGAMGAATLYQLARRGVRAVGIDRHSPPHDRGSTHGETRITRQAVGEGEAYVPLVLRAHEIWRELEAETGETLLTQCGCLIVGSGEGASGSRRAAFFAMTRRAAERYGIAHEMLTAAEIRARFPQFTPQDHEIGYFEPGGGFVDPERCVAAQLRRAGELGAVLRTGTTVLAIEDDTASVRIKTDTGDILAAEVVVSAGPWAPSLVGSPFDAVLSPSRQVMHWFPVEEDRIADWRRSPVFIWTHGPSPSDMFYGFPALQGHRAIKTAGEQYDETTQPDIVERDVAADESRAMRAAHIAGRLHGLGPVAEKSVTCLYAVTPDSHFLIDRHPRNDRVLVVSPCSGHGFKHSAGIGEAVADLATEGQSAFNLEPFALARFASAAA